MPWGSAGRVSAYSCEREPPVENSSTAGLDPFTVTQRLPAASDAMA